MHAITKLFVVLVAICSLMLAAAVVVFVNRVEDFRAERKVSEDARLAAEMRSNAANTEAVKAKSDRMAMEQALLHEQDDKKAAIDKAQTENNTLKVQLANAKTDNEAKEAANKGLVDVVAHSQATNQILEQQNAVLRKQAGDSNDKNRDLNTAVTDLSSKVATLERTARALKEDNAEKDKTIADQAKLIDAHPEIKASMADAASGDIPPMNVDVRGVVKDVQLLNGQVYATISVGSSNGVTKKMTFKVIDRQSGDFLGILTIDSVQPTDAFGKVEGPKVNLVRPNVEVKTQL